MSEGGRVVMWNLIFKAGKAILTPDTISKGVKVFSRHTSKKAGQEARKKINKSLKNLRKEQNARKKKRLNPPKRKRPLSPEEQSAIAVGTMASMTGIAAAIEDDPLSIRKRNAEIKKSEEENTLLNYPKEKEKAKGGYVKKYAKGGGVRKVRS